MSRQSIDNVLDVLAEVGLATVAEVGLATVAEVGPGSVDVQGPVPDLDVPGAFVESASVLLRGICSNCRPAEPVR